MRPVERWVRRSNGTKLKQYRCPVCSYQCHKDRCRKCRLEFLYPATTPLREACIDHVTQYVEEDTLWTILPWIED